MKRTTGIHHITAIVGHPQENVDFYAGVLGLRFVKRTVNFDDPKTYHLYFGNEGAEPGTIITFFPWVGAYPGKIGGGQAGVTTYVIPMGSLSFWEERLARFSVQTSRTERFGETYLAFSDPHGLRLELVERDGFKEGFAFGGVTADVAIRGFAGATLFSTRPKETIKTLTDVLGLEYVGEEQGVARFRASGDIGNVIDVNVTPVERGQMGVGTVHHIAWRAEDDADQLEWQRLVYENGHGVTDVQDRNYFNAIYFREPGEILFEIATDPPGFTQDETLETLGESLMLPERYEQYRDQLERRLIPITVRPLD